MEGEEGGKAKKQNKTKPKTKHTRGFKIHKTVSYIFHLFPTSLDRNWTKDMCWCFVLFISF